MKTGISKTITILVSVLMLSGCAAQIALNVAVKRDVNKDKKNYAKYMEKFEERYPEWTACLKDTFMTSPVNGARLHAIFMAAYKPTDKTAFILHGHTVCAAQMLAVAHWYSAELGYNVFLPDFQAHGLSEGKYRHMGWWDRFDMMQWIRMANNIFGRDGKDTRMVVTGISMGGATTMMVSAEVEKEGLEYVKCFIEDCGYTDFYNESAFVAKSMPLVPKDSVKRMALLDKVDALCLKQCGWSFRECSAVEQVRKCSLPMLFVHGGADTYVPTYMVYEVYDAKTKGEREILVVEGKDHGRAFGTQEYKEYVKGYLERHVK